MNDLVISDDKVLAIRELTEALEEITTMDIEGCCISGYSGKYVAKTALGVKE
jgi:hypothetical protein